MISLHPDHRFTKARKCKLLPSRKSLLMPDDWKKCKENFVCWPYNLNHIFAFPANRTLVFCWIHLKPHWTGALSELVCNILLTDFNCIYIYIVKNKKQKCNKTKHLYILNLKLDFWGTYAHACAMPDKWIIGYSLSCVFHFSFHFLCKCPSGKAWVSSLCGTEWIIGALSVEVQRQALNPY